MNVNYSGQRSFRLRGLGEDEAEKFVVSPLFQNWLTSLDTVISIEDVQVVSIDYKSNGAPMFAKLRVEAYDGYGRPLGGVVFLRGGSVAILPILVSAETGVGYIIFTVQPRLAIGEHDSVEIPAGMLDGDGHFGGVAAKEFKEEIGLDITLADLLDLTPPLPDKLDVFSRGLHPIYFPRGIAVSPGVCDETMRFYFFKRIMPQKEIDALEGKLTGNESEGESIRLKLVKFDKAPQETSDEILYRLRAGFAEWVDLMVILR